MSKPDENIVDAEIVEDEFKAPVLKDIKYPVNHNDIEEKLAALAEVPNIDLTADAGTIDEQYALVSINRKAAVKLRTGIDKLRKEMKAPALAYGAKVDSIAKEFQGKIAVVETKLLAACTKVEDHKEQLRIAEQEKEGKRVQAIEAKITLIKELPLQHFNSTSAQLAEAIESIAMPTEDVFQEFTEQAIEMREGVVTQLQDAWEIKANAEQAAETERLRVVTQKEEDDKRALIQKEEDDKREAAQKELQDKQDAFDLQQREAQDKIDAEKAKLQEDKDLLQKEKDDAAEKLRLAAEAEKERKAEVAEKKRLAAAKKKQAKIDAELFQERMSETVAAMGLFATKASLVEAIVGNKIPHVSWTV